MHKFSEVKLVNLSDGILGRTYATVEKVADILGRGATEIDVLAFYIKVHADILHWSSESLPVASH